MKKGLFLAGLVSLLGACTVGVGEGYHEVDGPYGEALYADGPAPAPYQETVVGVAPGPNYIWVGGYWTRYHDNWHWIHGRWARRPHENAHWIDGRWERHPRGYIWRSGHWQ